jgi:hypothetical protein
MWVRPTERGSLGAAGKGRASTTGGVSDRIRVRSVLSDARNQGQLDLTYGEVRQALLRGLSPPGVEAVKRGSSPFRRADRSTERGLAALLREETIEKTLGRYRLVQGLDPWQAVVDGGVGHLTFSEFQLDKPSRSQVRGLLLWIDASGLSVSRPWIRPESRKEYLGKARRMIGRIGLEADGLPLLAGRPAGMKRGPVTETP